MADDDISLVWQSNAAIAVNKPAGIPSQAAKGIESVETRLREQLQLSDGYLALPHRLDRAVSGVLLVALTKKAARLLSAQFASRKTAKHYLAVVEGCCSPETASVTWKDHLRKVDNRAFCESCSAEAAGAKLAETNVTIVSTNPERGVTRLAMSPITGRMHQLRLQAALRGHPIVGDRLYGATSDPEHPGQARTNPEADWSKNILLHARELEFHDPTTGRRIRVTAECPF